MTEEALAFADFVRDNPDAINQIDSPAQCVAVLDALARQVPASRLVPMTQHVLFGDKLLVHLTDLVAKDDRQEFALAVARFSDEYITAAIWNVWTVVRALTGADFKDLFEHCPALLEVGHPLYGELEIDTDAYWQQRVRRYAVRRDFRRAWDEINKARRGFVRQEGTPVGHVSRHKQEFGACSKEVLAELVGELFAAMCTKGLVLAITDTDMVLKSGVEDRQVFETKPTKGGNKIRSYRQRVTMTGLGFASLFFSAEMDSELARSRYAPKVFDETGAQILKLAAYFRDKKNKQRERRHDRAVRELERKQK